MERSSWLPTGVVPVISGRGGARSASSARTCNMLRTAARGLWRWVACQGHKLSYLKKVQRALLPGAH
eukprot:5606702-Lingulodinium_polyedra.AAC.1